MDEIEKRREYNRQAARRYRERNRERVRENSRKQYTADPQRRMASHRKWYDKVKDDPDFKGKALYLARKAYPARRARQIMEATGGQKRPAKCQVCGRGGKICFDHCHQRGIFRGWLCHSCNLILGHAGDDPAILVKLAAYLRKKRR